MESAHENNGHLRFRMGVTWTWHLKDCKGKALIHMIRFININTLNGSKMITQLEFKALSKLR